MEVEGYGLQVLEGGLNFIKKNRPIIIYENKINEKKVNKLLIENNYRIYYIEFPNDFKNFFHKRFNNLKELIVGKKIKIIYNNNKIPRMDHGNLIAIPAEKVK